MALSEGLDSAIIEGTNCARILAFSFSGKGATSCDKVFEACRVAKERHADLFPSDFSDIF